MMSESPLSVIDNTEVRNILPQAVPKVMLSAQKEPSKTSVSSREHESAEIAAVRLEEPKRMPLANHRC